MQDEGTELVICILQGMIAKVFTAEVEKFRGAKSGGTYNATPQLVDAKLEVVRAGWLFRHLSVVRRCCWLHHVDRVWRDEIDRCL